MLFICCLVVYIILVCVVDWRSEPFKMLFIIPISILCGMVLDLVISLVSFII